MFVTPNLYPILGILIETKSAGRAQSSGTIDISINYYTLSYKGAKRCSESYIS